MRLSSLSTPHIHNDKGLEWEIEVTTQRAIPIYASPRNDTVIISPKFIEFYYHILDKFFSYVLPLLLKRNCYHLVSSSTIIVLWTEKLDIFIGFDTDTKTNIKHTKNEVGSICLKHHRIGLLYMQNVNAKIFKAKKKK